MIHCVISETQSAFLKGRQILDGVLIANEIVDGAKKLKKKGGFCYQNRLLSWSHKQLSFCGRLTLLKSVLAALSTYYLSFFRAPTAIIRSVESPFKHFLWGGKNGERKICWVAWEEVCKEKGMGGLGIKNLGAFNLALLGKWVWRARAEHGLLWHKVLAARYSGLEVGDGDLHRRGSSWWRGITSIDNEGHGFSESWVRNNLVRTLGDGKEVRFWMDVWLGEGSLEEMFPRLLSLAVDKEVSVSDMGEWDGDEWNWRCRWRKELYQWEEALLHTLVGKVQGTMVRTSEADGWRWKADGSWVYSVKSAYGQIMTQSTGTRDHLFASLWSKLVPCKVAALGSRVIRNRLPTKTNLVVRGVHLGEDGLQCAGCGHNNESVGHLFFECPIFSDTWRRVLDWCRLESDLHVDCKSHFQQFQGLISGNKEAVDHWQVI